MKKLIYVLAIALVGAACDSPTYMRKVPTNANITGTVVSVVTQFDGITLYKVDIHSGPDIYVARIGDTVQTARVETDEDGNITRTDVITLNK